MIESPFQQNKEIIIPNDAKIVFVADMFKEDYVGGAELTTDALISSATLPVFKLHSKDVTIKTLESGHQAYWVFGNFSNLNVNLIPTIVANMSYSILEYDYKFCKYRSIEKHQLAEQKPCDCHESNFGKIISAFFYGAKSSWFMSESQQKRYFDRFPFLAEKENWVLSSVFDDAFFITLKMLREKYKATPRKGWLVIGSNSWIKGSVDAIKWCQDNDKEYKVIQDWEYGKVLEEMAQAEGFVYLPTGGDTCPRTVIEAKLLGCKLHINDNVQHGNEEWFSGVSMDDTEAYLYAARERFWSSIHYHMNWKPKISGYTTALNCLDNKYPFIQSIKSMLGFCDEVVVVDGGSKDGTWEELQTMSKLQGDGRLVVKQFKRDWNDKRFAVFDGAQKAEARKLCTGDFCWQQDADEIVHENDYQNIIHLVKNFPGNIDLVSLPIIEYWGSSKKVRMDVNPWKWRLSRNLEKITHGIPVDLRKIDEDGKLYASPGTDGCDYIDTEDGTRIIHASFYTNEIHDSRNRALLGDSESYTKYSTWFNSLIEQLPGVHHYSWFDMERKINTYKNYWQQHWESLYNIKQEDTAENNMFFQKPWSTVTDSDINELAEKLSNDIGGWIFHKPVDFSNPTPHIQIDRNEPKLMLEDK